MTRCSAIQLGVWWFVVTVWTEVLPVLGEIHCFCTLAACVSTGYMCKSSQDLCFSDHFGLQPSDLGHSRYGCLDLLAAGGSPSSSCQMDSVTKQMQSTSLIFLRTQKQEKTAVARRTCCRENMCNFHRDFAHLWRANRTLATSARGEPIGRGVSSDPPVEAEESAQQRLIWFRAAVIAVPIAGGCVLVLLVLLAARVLRRDAHQFYPGPEPIFVETVRGDTNSLTHQIPTWCVYHDRSAKKAPPLWCPMWWNRWHPDTKDATLV